MQFKVLSWNIWIDGYFDQVADFLKMADADIIGLQEVKDDDPGRDVIGYLKRLGYQHVFGFAEHSWGENIYRDGPAVFSKYDIGENKTHILSETESRVAVRADVQIGKELLHVFSTHLIHTHQQRSDIQDEQVENLLKVLPRERTIVMGDFNATPDSGVIRRTSSVLNDADPSSAPTWSVYPAGCPKCDFRGVQTRLDYIFTTKDIKISSFKVGDSKGSDHLPISVTVEF